MTIDTAATINSGETAVSAVNYGRGATAVTVNGDLASTSYQGVYVYNDGAATDLAVTTGVGSTVSGRVNGIAAYNVGTGATTITANGDVTGSYGGGGGIYAVNRANATDLTVTTGVGTSVTAGINALNNGTGATTVTVNGDATGGIRAANGASATDLTVTTGAGTTVSGGNSGIQASNFGIGSTTITANGNVAGAYFDGISAQTGDEAGDLTITTGAGTIVTGFADGIDAYNRGAGDITIVAGGDVYGTTGALLVTSNGIVATDDANAGDITVRTLAGTTVSGADRGISIVNDGTGAATVVADGDVSGRGEAGIRVINGARSATTDISITTNGDVTSAGGEENDKYGFAPSFSGILALNFGSGATTITVNGDVTATGKQGDGIYANNSGTATDLTVTTGAGTVVSGAYTGIRALNSGTGATTINVGGDVVGRTRDGIYARNGSTAKGPIAVTARAGASIESRGTGADAFGIQIEGAAGDVTVAGAVIGGAGGAIEFDTDNAFDDRLELQPGFAVTGVVDAGLGTDALVLGGPAGGGGGTLDIGLVSGDGTAEAGEQYVGFETFFKEDASVFELTGSNDEIAAFAVNGGTLLVDARMSNTAFDVGSGAVLGGAGTLGSFVAERGSVIAPGPAGGGIGTLNVTGEAAFEAGSTFRVDLATNGAADRVVADTAMIKGGTVAVNVTDPAAFYVDGRQSVIVDTANGREGTFDAVTDNNDSIFLGFDLIYNLNQVILETQRTPFSAVAATVNQEGAASGLSGLSTAPGSDALFVLDEVLLLSSVEAAQRAFDLSSGEIHASVQHALAGSGTLFAETLRRHAGSLGGTDAPGSAPIAYLGASGGGPSPFALAAGAPEAPVADYATASTFKTWAVAYGEQSEIDGDAGRGFGAADLDWDGAGLAGGVEGRLDDFFGGFADSFLLGVAGGYSESNADLTTRLSEADVTSGHIGIYTASQFGLLHLATASSYSWHDVEATRAIRFGAIDRVAEADYDANTFASSGEASLRFRLRNFTLAPLIAYTFALADRDGFTETGANALNLMVRDEDFTTGSIAAGVALGYQVTMGAMLVRTDVRIAYEHGFGDDRPVSVATLAGAPGSPFAVFGPEARDGRLAAGAGLGVSFTEALSASLRYDGAFGEDVESHRGHLSIAYRF